MTAWANGSYRLVLSTTVYPRGIDNGGAGGIASTFGFFPTPILTPEIFKCTNVVLLYIRYNDLLLNLASYYNIIPSTSIERHMF
jgi:hypothetical protein